MQRNILHEAQVGDPVVVAAVRQQIALTHQRLQRALDGHARGHTRKGVQAANSDIPNDRQLAGRDAQRHMAR